MDITVREESVMSYHYEVLEEVLISVGKDFSDENIYTQLQRLSSDEMAKLKYLFDVAEPIEACGGPNPFGAGDYWKDAL